MIRINPLFYLFFTVVPSNVTCFFPVSLSSLIWHFQQVGVEVSPASWLRQLANYPSQETEETSTPTWPVENVILMTKGLQERKTQCWMGRRWKISKVINNSKLYGNSPSFHSKKYKFIASRFKREDKLKEGQIHFNNRPASLTICW